MRTLNLIRTIVIVLLLFAQTTLAQELKRIEMNDTYPWCIVAYDSLERSPKERVQMIKDLGFSKYAYDWRDRHLDETFNELKLATENDIEIISVWLWLNAKRDSIGQLSVSNERVFKILERLNLKTTFWVSLSENFFTDLNQEQCISMAVEMVKFIAEKADNINCSVALYNHSGWFGNPFNQLEVIKALPNHKLSIVYNFHHAHGAIDEFSKIAEAIRPYLSAVNLNGMQKDSEKILTIGKGNHEKEMINILRDLEFEGPWGILGHVENVDAEKVLIQNIEGLRSLQDN